MYTGPLFIASDHGGFDLKNKIVLYIKDKLELKITDLGPHELVEDDDFPDYAFPLAEKVAEKNGRGILICRNGIGVCIAANKVKGIRAGIGYNTKAAETMRNDDDTNILCLAGDYGSEEYNIAIVQMWLEKEFSGEERFVRRIKKIEEYKGN